MSQKRWGDILVIGGGIIPPDDAKKLKEQGIAEIFGSGTDTRDIIALIMKMVPTDQLEANVLKQIDHIGIAVFNLSEALKKYERLFQVKPKYIETMDALSVRIAFVPVGEVMLELLEPLTPGKGRIAEFLEKYGEGVHHIAYRVDNLEALLAEMKKAGVKLRDEKPRPGGHGSWIAFIGPEETGNVLTELVERHGEL